MSEDLNKELKYIAMTLKGHLGKVLTYTCIHYQLRKVELVSTIMLVYVKLNQKLYYFALSTVNEVTFGTKQKCDFLVIWQLMTLSNSKASLKIKSLIH